MNPEHNTDNYTTPTRRSLIISSLIAVCAAIVILVTVILPAEYNLDPTGAGKLLGLTELSGSFRQGSMNKAAGAVPPDQAAPKSSTTTTAGSHPSPYRTEIIEIKMAPGDELEYKATLAQHEPLLYSWETDNQSLVYYDFHGEPIGDDNKWPEGYFISYEEKQDGASSANGYLVAPFTGNHGWYMLNFNDSPVTVSLKISGNFSWHGFVGRWNNYGPAGGGG